MPPREKNQLVSHVSNLWRTKWRENSDLNKVVSDIYVTYFREYRLARMALGNQHATLGNRWHFSNRVCHCKSFLGTV